MTPEIDFYFHEIYINNKFTSRQELNFQDSETKFVKITLIGMLFWFKYLSF